MAWFYLGTAAANTYPTGDMSSRAASTSATPADSAVLNASTTTITGFQMGPAHSAGPIEFRVHDTTTVMREVAGTTVSGTNAGANVNTAPFVLHGPWTVFADAGGACDLYIHYESQDSWV